VADRYRLPDGQHLTTGFPVLHYGQVARVDLEKWRFRVFGEVRQPLELTLEDLKRLPVTDLVADIHCVTTWSKFDTRWRGVRFSEIHKLVAPAAGVTYGLAHAEQGYTTGLPLAAWLDDDVLIAWEYDGEPLTAEHGGPVRMVVPKRYFYKSAKWVTGMEYLSRPQLGFWERNGYSEGADPWREERYA
jgi:DMSO/TMAO reductase YedYZ molybdopterin-dependent catalytic subunit